MFGNIGDPTDLAARNIHRGRVEIMASLDFVATTKNFKTQTLIVKVVGKPSKYEGMSNDIWTKMQEVYDHPSDIDLFTGGIAQQVEDQSQLGKVFKAMIKDQFQRTMEGDRFFFNHKKKHNLEGVGFTKKARKILLGRTMSGIICDTTGLTKVPSNVFHLNSQIIDCTETAKIDKAAIKKFINFAK